MNFNLIVTIDQMNFHKSRAAGLKKTAGLIEKETLKKRISNNEFRISNIEGMYPIFSEKDQATRGASACAARAIPPFDIRYSKFDSAELVAGCGSAVRFLLIGVSHDA